MLTALRLFNRHSEGLLIVWAVLVAVTMASAGVGAGNRSAGAFLASAVVTAAFVKAWLIGMYFMDLKHAPSALRYAFVGYLSVVWAVLVFGFYV